MSSRELLSLDQVAERLGLHVRTVRSYVRAGRLKAIRIGKQYRVARADLEAFTGRSPQELETQAERASRHIDVSSVVQIDAIDVELSSRLTRQIMATLTGRPDSDGPLRVDTIYDPERSHLKVILNGSISTTASLLRFIAFHLASYTAATS